jgi:hypothetical protein
VPGARPPASRPGLSALLGWRSDVVQVVPGLRIGSVSNAHQARRLVAEGVNCVADVRPEAYPAVSWPEGVCFTRIPMGSERLPSADQLLEAASFVIVLMNLGNEVLVHCKDGLDRAPMVACAVLVLQGTSLAEARERIGACRPEAAPRDDQLPLLRELEASRPAPFDDWGTELVGRHVEAPTAVATPS